MSSERDAVLARFESHLKFLQSRRAVESSPEANSALSHWVSLEVTVETATNGAIVISLDEWQHPEYRYSDRLMSDWLDADQQISDSLRREMQMEIGERYESRRNRAVWEYRVNPSQTIALADQFHLSDICDLTSFIYDHFGAGEETRQSQQLHRSIFAIVGLPTFFDTTEDIVGSIELLLETMYGNEFVMMNNIYPPDELELGYY